MNNNFSMYKYKDNFARYSDVKSQLIFSDNIIQKSLITICIPTYKREKNIYKTLESAINQTKTIPYSIIIVDNDNNSDGTIIREICSNFNSGIVSYYRNEANIGMFGNWNRCVELAKTKYIAFLHDDDLLDSDYIYRMSKILKKYSNSNIGYIKTSTRDYYIGNGIKKDRYSFINRILKNKLIKCTLDYNILIGDSGYIGAPTCGSLFLRDAVLSLGGFNEELYPSADAFLPFSLLGKYDVFMSVSPFGTRIFGENESCKFDTLNKWAQKYLLFQDYLFSNYKLSKKYIDEFEYERFELYLDGFFKYKLVENIIITKEMFYPNEKYSQISIKKKKKLLRLIRKKRIKGYIRSIFS